MPSCSSSYNGCCIKTGVLEHALGSAYVHDSSACITVGIFGPRQVPAGDSRKHAKINVVLKLDGLAAIESGQSGLQSSKSISDTCHMLEEVVQESLQSILVQESLGMLQYDVVVHCHNNMDTIFGVDEILTATSMAFVDAGIPMLDILACTTLLIQEPYASSQISAGSIVIVSTTSFKEIVSLKVKGDVWKFLPVSNSIKESQRSFRCRSATRHYSISSVQEAVQVCLAENSRKRELFIESLECGS